MIVIGQYCPPLTALFTDNPQVSRYFRPVTLLFCQIRNDQIPVADSQIVADLFFCIIKHGIIRTVCSKRDKSCLLQQSLYFLRTPAEIVEKFHTAISQLRNLAQRTFKILLQFFSKRIQLKTQF
ncbi:hypothetical protein D3C76_1393490 [compost metagenome]